VTLCAKQTIEAVQTCHTNEPDLVHTQIATDFSQAERDSTLGGSFDRITAQ
jgi:hypothetical protein